MKVKYIKGRTLEVDGKNIDDMNAYEQAAIILKVANKIVLKKQSHKHKLKSLLIAMVENFFDCNSCKVTTNKNQEIVDIVEILSINI